MYDSMIAASLPYYCDVIEDLRTKGAQQLVFGRAPRSARGYLSCESSLIQGRRRG